MKWVELINIPLVAPNYTLPAEGTSYTHDGQVYRIEGLVGYIPKHMAMVRVTKVAK